VALGVISHVGVQGFAKKSFEQELVKRTTEYSGAMSQSIEHTYKTVYFDYMSLSVKAENVQFNVGGSPGIASVSVGSYSFSPMDSSVVLNNVNALSIIPAGGALSIASLNELSMSGDQVSKGADWETFSLGLDGLQISDVFFKNRFSKDVGLLVKGLMKDGALSVNIEIDKVNADKYDAVFSTKSKGAFSFGLNVSYIVSENEKAGTVLDPDTGLPLELATDQNKNTYLISKFGLLMEDLGFRDTLFNWGAGYVSKPSVDDVSKFKENFVNGLDSYVNQVMQNPVLPVVAMNDFVSFVSDGGSFAADVEFIKPVKSEKLWLHLMGVPQESLYKKAIVSSEVK